MEDHASAPPGHYPVQGLRQANMLRSHINMLESYQTQTLAIWISTLHENRMLACEIFMMMSSIKWKVEDSMHYKTLCILRQ
jgi:hypothetical protein